MRVFPLAVTAGFVLAVGLSGACSRDDDEKVFRGEFVNVDPNTGGICRAVLVEWTGVMWIQLFGACTPGECKYPMMRLVPITRLPDGEIAEGFARWDASYAVSEISVERDGDTLTLTDYTIFTDFSGRPPMQEREILLRTDQSELDLEPRTVR